MLLSDETELADHVWNLATQARKPLAHYEHTEIGYNYWLSNILAVLRRTQLRVLEQWVAARRWIFERYRDDLGDIEGVAFMPDAGWGCHTRWLTTLIIYAAWAGVAREDVRRALDAEHIEARPVWKLMHSQPVFQGVRRFRRAVAEEHFRVGLCLPSVLSLTEADLDRITGMIRMVLYG